MTPAAIDPAVRNRARGRGLKSVADMVADAWHPTVTRVQDLICSRAKDSLVHSQDTTTRPRAIWIKLWSGATEMPAWSLSLWMHTPPFSWMDTIHTSHICFVGVATKSVPEWVRSRKQERKRPGAIWDYGMARMKRQFSGSADHDQSLSNSWLFCLSPSIPVWCNPPSKQFIVAPHCHLAA